MSAADDSPAPVTQAPLPPPTADDPDHELNAFLKPLALDLDTLHHLAYHFSKTYQQLALNSDEQFLPTPVTKLPTGQETGRYLAIDVGGTNLRVGFIELLGDVGDSATSQAASDSGATEKSRDALKKAQRPRIRRTLEKAWPIGEHLKMDQAEDLFAWIGDCIAEVVSDSLKNESTKLGDVPDVLDLGITFSFPMMQDTLDEATLMPMGKGFAITSDLNLGKMLLAGYSRHTQRPNGTSHENEPSSKRRKLFSLPKLKIAAITNDTVATLASLAYQVKSLPNSRVAMGIIVGTGCNATIPMKLSFLPARKKDSVCRRAPQAQETVVNTEWTIGGAAPPLNGLGITTKWDKELDAATARPGFQPFEYMTGGRYIGELVRLIVYDFFTSIRHFSSSELPVLISTPQALTTMYLSFTVARSKSDATLAETLSEEHPPPPSSPFAWTDLTAKVLRKIAFVVQSRSAGLTAAATVGLLACCGEIILSPVKQSSPPNDATGPIDNISTEMPSASAQNPSLAALATNLTRDGLSPAPTPQPNWHSGPEELVVAYTGGIIQHYPHWKDTCQRFIDRLVMRGGPQDSGKSVFLREASDGGIIGAGVLAGTVLGR